METKWYHGETTISPDYSKPKIARESSNFPIDNSPVRDAGHDSTQVEYFAISPTRLAILSVITSGLYEFYWFYRNWKAIQQTERSHIMPFWRAFFAVLFCYPLFERVLRSTKSNGYQDYYSSAWLAATWITLTVLGRIGGRVDVSDAWTAMLILGSILSFWPLLPVQKAVNANSQSVFGSSIKREFSTGEIVITVIGVALSIGVITSFFA